MGNINCQMVPLLLLVAKPFILEQLPGRWPLPQIEFHQSAYEYPVRLADLGIVKHHERLCNEFSLI